MIREVKFESQDRRIKQILAALNENGIKDIEEANAICDAAGIDPYKTCEETQPICRLSASLVLLPTTVRLVLVMATSLHVCSAKRLSASLSWLATSRLLLLKALSKSLPKPTKFAKSLCA